MSNELEDEYLMLETFGNNVGTSTMIILLNNSGRIKETVSMFSKHDELSCTILTEQGREVVAKGITLT